MSLSESIVRNILDMPEFYVNIYNSYFRFRSFHVCQTSFFMSNETGQEDQFQGLHRVVKFA